MSQKNLNELFKQGTVLANEFISFNSKAFSPYNAVLNTEKLLKKESFQELKESDQWKLEKGNSYYIKRGYNSSILAFTIPMNFDSNQSLFKMVGTHTDSPCIRLAPKFETETKGFKQVFIQSYGGGLWHTWFDRPLGLGGRLLVQKNDKIETIYYTSSKPVALISSMCPHLQQTYPLDIKKENDLRPIIGTELLQQLGCGPNGEAQGLKEFLGKEIGVSHEQILNFDLCFAEWNESSIFGVGDEFISAPRMDNLYSVFCSLKALIDVKNNEKYQKNSFEVNMIAAFDHEEIGSESYVGANCEFLRDILERITFSLGFSSKEDYSRILRRSFLLSCDMAHSLHPNYMGNYQSNHSPIMNKGVVLKVNANGRYTSDGVTGGIVKFIAQQNDLPMQEFIINQNTRCGSTIGPMLTSLLGCMAVDLGAPMLGMHSVRETAGVLDFYYYSQYMKCFFETELMKTYPEN